MKIVVLFTMYFRLVIGCQRDFSHADFERDIIASRRISALSLTTNEAILCNSFDNISMSQWSSYYTHGAHLAGKNKSMAQWTADRFNEYGVPASLAEYSVFLSYPVSQSISLNYSNGSSHDLELVEDAISQDETTTYPNSIPGFHGYSATRDVQAEYVYVGSGHRDDFARLISLGVDLTGKIALAKYGGIFRGLKVKNAELHGMIGCILFTDPGSDGDITEMKGYTAYPNGPARQPSSIQRGTVMDITLYGGDPTTPGSPSTPGCDRTDGSLVLPQIPSIPISYRNVIPLLNALDGHGIIGENVSRDGWIGGLNATYSTGPAPGAVIRMSNVMEEVIRPLWNVIGIINGTHAEETIIIGNHRDAWVIGGAADPNSGTAILVELTKAFGKLLKTGWVPKRNMVIASWDGEEYGLVGSTEWVEEYAPWLSATAMTYLNVDIAVGGPIPGAGATPELHAMALDIMTKVVYPQGSNTTLYDIWSKTYRFQPVSRGFESLGSDSDYTAFLQYGIGSLDFGFGGGAKDPVYHYHSNYDSYYWMTTYGDPGFQIHQTAGQYLALLAYHLADDAIIPFDIVRYADEVDHWFGDAILGRVNTGDEISWRQQQLGISPLFDSVKALAKAAKALVTYYSQPSFTKDESKVDVINRKLRDFQRVWVKQGLVLGREEGNFYRNIAYAPDVDSGYAPTIFPGFAAAWANGEWRSGNFTAAKYEVMKIKNAIDAAIEILKVPT